MEFIFHTCCGCCSIINVPTTKFCRSVRIFWSKDFTSVEGISSSNCLTNCLKLQMISARSSHHFLILFNLFDAEKPYFLWSFFHCISSSSSTFSWTYLYFSETTSKSDINFFLSVSNVEVLILKALSRASDTFFSFFTSGFCNPN